MDANDKVTFTVTAAQYNQILGLLYEVAAPARVTVPLIQTLEQQSQQIQQAANGGVVGLAASDNQHVPH